MHFKPISRINSAIATPSLCGRDALVELYNAIIDSGEFIVIVAAVEMPLVCAGTRLECVEALVPVQDVNVRR
jgi:hypothetical protein